MRLAFEEVGIDLVVVFVKHSRFSGIGALNGKPRDPKPLAVTFSTLRT